MGPRGRNEVTHEHVGRRVSFQYELPNGYVGEVVGNLEWFDGTAETFVVKDRRGALVRVPLRGVRHGRLVRPQRPKA